MEEGKIDRRRRYTLSVIREAFFALLAEVGFARMTVADICRRADINRGTFYLHYEDKFALLDALIDEALAAAPPLEGTEAEASASVRRQTMTIICSTRMTMRTPGWRSASSSAALSRWSLDHGGDRAFARGRLSALRPQRPGKSRSQPPAWLEVIWQFAHAQELLSAYSEGGMRAVSALAHRSRIRT